MDPGAHVLFEPQTGVITVSHQIAVDADVRKLLDLIRKRLGDALRGRSTPELRKTWGLTPIVGGPSLAETQITLQNNTADDYIRRNLESKLAEVVPQAIAEWLQQAFPAAGEVSTSPIVDTSGGALPE